jgi:hypothetical protein
MRTGSGPVGLSFEPSRGIFEIRKVSQQCLPAAAKAYVVISGGSERKKTVQLASR